MCTCEKNLGKRDKGIWMTRTRTMRERKKGKKEIRLIEKLKNFDTFKKGDWTEKSEVIDRLVDKNRQLGARQG